MKLLFTTADARDGRENDLDFVRALARLDHDVFLAALGGSLDDQGRRSLEGVSGLTVVESPFQRESGIPPDEDATWEADWLGHVVDEIAPDLLHLGGLVTRPVSLRRPIIVSVSRCELTRWDALHDGAPMPSGLVHRRARARDVLDAADVVVAPTRAMLGVLRRVYGTRSDGRVIQGGRGPGLPPPLPKESFVLFAGRTRDDGDNAAALERAAEAIRWPVVTVDDGPPQDGRTPHPGVARALGTLEPGEMNAWIGRAAVFAFPARYDPNGLGPLAAAASGCALVLGDIPSLREVWGNAAFYVDPDDHRALAGTLESLLEHPRGRIAAGRRARERAGRLTAAASAKRYDRLYRELTAG